MRRKKHPCDDQKQAEALNALQEFLVCMEQSLSVLPQSTCRRQHQTQTTNHGADKESNDVKVKWKLNNYTENVYKYLLIYLHSFKIHKNSGITNEEQILKVGEISHDSTVRIASWAMRDSPLHS